MFLCKAHILVQHVGSKRNLEKFFSQTKENEKYELDVVLGSNAIV